LLACRTYFLTTASCSGVLAATRNTPPYESRLKPLHGHGCLNTPTL
jgi:hypothetical protein